MKTNPRMYWDLPYIVPPTYELPTDVSPMERIMEELRELRAAHPGKKKRPAKKEKSTKPRREKKKPKKKDK